MYEYVRICVLAGQVTHDLNILAFLALVYEAHPFFETENPLLFAAEDRDGQRRCVRILRTSK